MRRSCLGLMDEVPNWGYAFEINVRRCKMHADEIVKTSDGNIVLAAWGHTPESLLAIHVFGTKPITDETWQQYHDLTIAQTQRCGQSDLAITFLTSQTPSASQRRYSAVRTKDARVPELVIVVTKS